MSRAVIDSRSPVAADRPTYQWEPARGGGALALRLFGTLGRRELTRIVDAMLESGGSPRDFLRIDFEDGFGNRPDEEEDRFALTAGDEVAAGLSGHLLPPRIGIRIKPLNEELKRRSLRTFDMFLTRLLDRTGGKLPQQFQVQKIS